MSAASTDSLNVTAPTPEGYRLYWRIKEHRIAVYELDANGLPLTHKETRKTWGGTSEVDVRNAPIRWDWVDGDGVWKWHMRKTYDKVAKARQARQYHYSQTERPTDPHWYYSTVYETKIVPCTVVELDPIV